MTVSYLNSQIGLALLGGSASLSALTGSGAIESAAVRKAKAAFTLQATTPPWKDTAASTTPVSSQVAAIKRLISLVDKPDTGLPVDVQTSFAAYKAVDRLRVLADAATKTTLSATERTALQATFTKGLSDLQGFLATAPSDDLLLAFAMPDRTVKSVAVPSPLNTTKTPGVGVSASRSAPIEGLAGSETLRITLTKGSTTETVELDLSATPQPPTLDSIAEALNTAIASVPMRDTAGNIVLDGGGNPKPLSTATFVVEKSNGKWGLTLQAPSTERVALDQVGAGDALMVATGETGAGIGKVQVLRYDDPATGFERAIVGTISATDRHASAAAKLADPKKDAAAARVAAQTDARAMVTDEAGFSYVVGTAAGDLDANLRTSGKDLYLTKLDSEGTVVWQRTLGMAGNAEGAAISLTSDGVVVAGSLSGTAAAANTAGSDMVVARYGADGDEMFATTVRMTGDQQARAVTAAADGTVYVGGQTGTDAFVTRFDATGILQERHTVAGGANESVSALAVDGSGSLLVLTREGAASSLRKLDGASLATDQGSISLGAVDARVMAVAADGTVVVAGAENSGPSGGKDGFIARISGDLASSAISHVGSAGNDEIDSIAFLNGSFYVAGRTTGDLGGDRMGKVDGFIGRFDLDSGTLDDITQFGKPALSQDPVRISGIAGGNTVLGALGLHRGTLNPDMDTDLMAQTSLRPGDAFSIRIGSGVVRNITILEGDTVTSLARRISLATWNQATVTAARTGGTLALKFEAQSDRPMQLIAGKDGQDALAKLGIEPMKLVKPDTATPDTPKVVPGGRYGLSLSDGLNLNSAADAKTALDALKAALSVTRSAYRSLYWDSTKAGLVEGKSSVALTPRQQTQLDQYTSALNRLTALNAI